MDKGFDFDKRLKSDFYIWSKNNLLMTLSGIFKLRVKCKESVTQIYTRYSIEINGKSLFYFDNEPNNVKKTEFFLIVFYLAVEEYVSQFGLPDNWIDFSIYLFRGELNARFYIKDGNEKHVLLQLNNKFLKNKINEYFLGKS
jgi:hypothetical protein